MTSRLTHRAVFEHFEVGIVDHPSRMQVVLRTTKTARNLYTSYVGIPSICIGKHSFFMCVIRSMTVIMIMIYYHHNEVYSQHLLLLRNLGHFDKKKTLPPNALFWFEGTRSCLFHSAYFCFPDGSGDSFAKTGSLVRGNHPRKPRW